MLLTLCFNESTYIEIIVKFYKSKKIVCEITVLGHMMLKFHSQNSDMQYI